MHDAPTAAMTRPHDIQPRTFALACEIIQFCRQLNKSDVVVRRLGWQLLDAGTSIGANLEEADAGQTKRDFIATTAIGRKESAETRYWLRLIAFAEPLIRSRTAPLIDECHQIFKILTTIIKNAESNPDRGIEH